MVLRGAPTSDGRDCCHFVKIQRRPLQRVAIAADRTVSPEDTPDGCSRSQHVEQGTRMQRRVHPAAATGFERSAELYELGRPDYPPAALEWLSQRLDLRVGRTVIDLAAGTGKLTRLLVGTRSSVIAVEPVHAMCAVLARVAPEVAVVEGTAEAMPVCSGCADAVTVAQAFHWFDGHSALREIHRVLRTRGVLALVWNRRKMDDPLHQEISRIIDPYRGDTPSHHREHWQAPLRETALFDAGPEVALRHEQVLDVDGLIARVGSTSFIAALPSDELQRVVTALRALADRQDRLVLPYRTEIQTFNRSRSRAERA